MASVTIRKFEKEDVAQVQEHFKDAMQRVPPFKGTEIPEAEMKAFESEVLAPVEKGFSLVAEDAGKIVGFVVNQEIDDQKFLSETADSDHKVVAMNTEIINFLRKESKLMEKHPNIKKLLHVDVIYVIEEYCRKGIGTRFIKESLQVAAQNGFDCVVMEALSDYISKEVVKDGFEELHKVDLKEWKSADGTTVTQVINLDALDGHNIYSLFGKVMGK